MNRCEERERMEGKEREYRCHCPFCRFMDRLCREREGYEEFWDHMDRARIEVLEGLKALLEGKIERIKKRGRGSRDFTKIEVEESE